MKFIKARDWIVASGKEEERKFRDGQMMMSEVQQLFNYVDKQSFIFPALFWLVALTGIAVSIIRLRYSDRWLF